MRFHALACDYDGTIARDGRVADATRDALRAISDSGRRLLMVTGRELDDLVEVFPGVEDFDLVVAENGAVLYDPATRERRALTEPPPVAFVEALGARGVSPLSVGEVIVATWEPHQVAVLETIHELGLELQVIFNKGAVMVLPAGVTKASGLQAAVAELGLTVHEVVGVGDAENDHAFLACCECAVAVANALPAVKERCDLVTEASHGAGVAELARRLVEDDLADLPLARHDVLLGEGADGAEVRVSPARRGLLVTGQSGSGKSSLVGGLLERLDDAGYRFCLVDPEGDYEQLGDAVVVGDAERPPAPEQIAELLARPTASVIVNLLAVPLDDRPGVFERLMPIVASQRSVSGRPHWLVIDEAHHLLPPAWQAAPETLPRDVSGLLLVSVHPEWIADDALRVVDGVIGVGPEASGVVESVAAKLGLDAPSVPDAVPEGMALLWNLARDEAPQLVRPAPAGAERHRHRRKYAEGELPEDRSFWFRGPDDRLRLRAQNLVLFAQIGDGVDDETWLHHLRQGDYSTWMRTMIKDDELADQVAEVERELADDPETSRARIRELVEERYTLPARQPGARTG